MTTRPFGDGTSVGATDPNVDSLHENTLLAVGPSAFAPVTGELLGWLASQRSEATRRAYRQHLANFARWCGLPTPEAASEAFLRLPREEALAAVFRYRSTLLASDSPSGTINNRLSALRSLAAWAKALGRIEWDLALLRSEKVEAYRDTAGPGLAAVERMYRSIPPVGLRGLRDRAMLRILWDLSLRRNEMLSLRREDIDLGAGRIMALRKGGRDRKPINLPDPTKAALGAYLDALGDADGGGPIWRAIDRHGTVGGPLTGRTLHKLLWRLGHRVGVDGVHPHGIRHSSLTHLAELTGDVVLLQAQGGWSSLQVATRYLDRPEERQRKASRRTAEALE